MTFFKNMTQTPQNDGLYATETISNTVNTEDIEINQNSDELLREWHEFAFGEIYQEQSAIGLGTISQMLDLSNADIFDDSPYTWSSYIWDGNTSTYDVAEYSSNNNPNNNNIDSFSMDLMDSGSISKFQEICPTLSTSPSETSATSNMTPQDMENPSSDLSPSLSPKTVYTCDFCARPFVQKGLLR